MRSNQWKQRKALSAVQAARDGAEQLTRVRGLLAIMLATYWERGDGHYPPNFIVSATDEANLLSEEELGRVGVKRNVSEKGVWYTTIMRDRKFEEGR